jgi:hypothetical protein
MTNDSKQVFTNKVPELNIANGASERRITIHPDGTTSGGCIKFDNQTSVHQCFPGPFIDGDYGPCKNPSPILWPSTTLPLPVKGESKVEEKLEQKVEPAHTFLEEAGNAMKARAELRDTPGGERTAAKIAQVFNSLTVHDLTEADVWQLLIILKMVRARSGKYNRDDYVDMAAYSGLLGECESKNPDRNK